MVLQQQMLAFDEEVGRKLEALYTTRDVMARRRAAIDAVQPRPGEYGLDIGPGPGFIACELARSVGAAGRVTAVDANPAMLGLTQHRARQEGVADWLEVHQADAAELPLLDNVFDFVVAVQVCEYVPAIERALSAAHRVLRPGGRLAIIDTDWDTLVIHADGVEVATRIERAWDEHLAHRTLPRRLLGLLHRAGFQLTGRDLVPVLNLEYDPRTYGFGLIGLMADFARGRAGVTPADVDAWLADIERQHVTGSYFFSLNQYLFRATKPEASGP
jgi:ubiquinone/menaquinone biosynthesis C-methylase UbiE